MSMLENLEMIKEQGMESLLAREAEKWRCPVCGGVTSCHNNRCYTCLPDMPKSRKKKPG